MTLIDRYAAELRQAAGPLHEIVLRNSGGYLALACTCLRVTQPGRPGWLFIEMRRSFPAAEAMAAYRGWHASRGIEVRP